MKRYCWKAKKIFAFLFTLSIIFYSCHYDPHGNSSVTIIGAVGGQPWESQVAVIDNSNEFILPFFILDEESELDPCDIILDQDVLYYISGTFPNQYTYWSFNDGINITNPDFTVNFHNNGVIYPATEGVMYFSGWSSENDIDTSITINIYAKANEENKVVGTMYFYLCPGR